MMPLCWPESMTPFCASPVSPLHVAEELVVARPFGVLVDEVVDRAAVADVDVGHLAVDLTDDHRAWMSEPG